MVEKDKKERKKINRRRRTEEKKKKKRGMGEADEQRMTERNKRK